MNRGLIERAVMNRAAGAVRTTLSLSCLALVGSGCSARLDVAPEPVQVSSCSTLRASQSVGVEPPETGALVWLMSEPPRSSPLVVNWAARRIAGQAARWASYLGRAWLVSEDHGLSVERASSERIEGWWVSCDRGTSERYVAVPLAPSVDDARGLSELARFSGGETAWPAERTSDLALQRPELVVVARGVDGLRWLEVAATGDAVSEVGHLPTLLGDDYNDVAALNERYLAVASRLRGLVIVDADDPRQPRVVTDSLPELLPRDGHSVFVEGKRLYWARAPTVGTGAVVAFDVSQPESPRQLWRWQAEPGHDAHDVTVRGDRIYVSSMRGGVTVLDGSGDEPRVVGRRGELAAHSCSVISDEPERLLWGEERLGGSLHLIEVERNRQGVRLADTRVSLAADEFPVGDGGGFSASPHNAECAGSLCFVAHYQLGLRVLDFGALPAAGEGAIGVVGSARYPTWRPSAVGESTWLRGATGVALALPWVYVADTEAGLVVLRYDAASANARD